MLEICKVLALWGPPPGPPWRATHTIWTTLNPLPLRMIPAKFGLKISTMRFHRRRWKCKKFTDVRLSTHDGRISDGNSSARAFGSGELKMDVTQGLFFKGTNHVSESHFGSRSASWLGSSIWTTCVHKHCKCCLNHETGSAHCKVIFCSYYCMASVCINSANAHARITFRKRLCNSHVLQNQAFYTNHDPKRLKSIFHVSKRV